MIAITSAPPVSQTKGSPVGQQRSNLERTDRSTTQPGQRERVASLAVTSGDRDSVTLVVIVEPHGDEIVGEPIRPPY